MRTAVSQKEESNQLSEESPCWRRDSEIVLIIRQELGIMCRCHMTALSTAPVFSYFINTFLLHLWLFGSGESNSLNIAKRVFFFSTLQVSGW